MKGRNEGVCVEQNADDMARKKALRFGLGGTWTVQSGFEGGRTLTCEVWKERSRGQSEKGGIKKGPSCQFLRG